MITKCYSELITLPTFLDRYEYLKIGGKVGAETFGHDRYLNQLLYRSDEWREFRDWVIIRDNGCDLACIGFQLYERILIHHINPITANDIVRRDPKVFDPENVISTCLNTHNAIHYGDASMLALLPLERTPNDTCPWRKEDTHVQHFGHDQRAPWRR
jgi:hypothetical protein